MFITKDTSIFLINDDVLIEHILSGRTFNGQGDISPFISYILSKLFNYLYFTFGTKLSFYGIFLFILNFICALILFNTAIRAKNLFLLITGIAILIILFPTFFYAPTFTITAFLAIGIGFIGLLSYLTNHGRSFSLIILLNLVIVLGLLVRPQALYGFLVFFGPLLIYNIFQSAKITKIIFSISLSFIFVIFFLDKFLKNIFLTGSLSHLNYFKFVELRAELSFTNAIFRAQQLIVDNAIPNSPFNSLDFLLLLNWFNLDASKFNFINLNYVISFVEKYRGINAIFNTNFFENSQRLFVETSSLNKFWVLFVFILFIVIGKTLTKTNFYFIGLLLISFFFGFYFLAAAGRLPYRTIFPIAVLLLASILTLKEFNFGEKRKFITILFCFILSLFTIDFHFNNYFGFKQIYINNNNSINFYVKRDENLSYFLKENYVILSPLDVLPMSIQGTTYKNLNWKSSSNSVSIDWTVGSPSWKSKIKNLKISNENVFESLTRNKNFYYAGTSDSAHILRDYMTQNDIDVKEICPIANIDGLDIFSYQAKESDC